MENDEKQTLHCELDEPSALSIGVDSVAGEEDWISSLGWVQLEKTAQKRSSLGLRYIFFNNM